MSIDASGDVHPFDVSDGRALVSIGPLSTRRYCTYSCPFCYVHASAFASYPTFSPSAIVQWLQSLHEPVNVVYVSGDTDSFAPPRMTVGLDLLEALCKLKVDLLFTTRALFTDESLDRLSRIRRNLADNGRRLFGCVSVAQLEHPLLEPPPIAAPAKRLQQLRRFKECGLVSVLTLRPFLPVVPAAEYVSIINLAEGAMDAVLGSVWFTDSDGVIRRKVLGADADESLFKTFIKTRMDFDKNKDVWLVYEGRSTEDAIRKTCVLKGIPFFMRSGDLIEWVRTSPSGMVSGYPEHS